MNVKDNDNHKSSLLVFSYLLETKTITIILGVDNLFTLEITLI